MRLVRSTRSADVADQGCVLTIGNFDAVHLGHRKMLASLRSQGIHLGLPTVVMTFEPHPGEYFSGSRGFPRLSNLSTRFFALRDSGIDIMLNLRFDRRLASMEAMEFVRNILGKELAVRYLLVGDDFRFGRNRRGDFELLSSMTDELGYDLERTETLSLHGERVSSTRIRRLLSQGDLNSASELLGRPYTMVGRIIRGQQLGRQWGFPTLNLPIHHTPALTGVYAVRVQGLDDKPLPGVANLGTRPTVGGLRTLLEVYLFDFDRSVYGRRVCVEFVARIRQEQRFDSFDALKRQIQKDCVQAREMLGRV